LIIQPRQIDLQHLCFDLPATHLSRMFLAVKENAAANPLQVGVFGAHAVVLHAQSVAYLVEQTW
jgi:hypothetical protein